MIGILAEATAQSVPRVTADIDRDYILRGDAAVEYGLVDEVVEFRDLRSVPDEFAIAR